jgi:hypothetical protein
MGRCGQAQGNDMATLEKRRSGYRLVFWYRSERFQGSLKTENKREAERIKGRVEENLDLLARGRLDYNPGDDLFMLMLSDGRVNLEVLPI